MAFTAVVLGMAGVVFSVSAWVLWALIRPGSAGAQPNSLTVILALLLGAVWLLVVMVAGLAVVFGGLAWRSGPPALWGLGLGVLSGLLSLGGAIVFAVTVANWSFAGKAG
ncbi:hypothetical protein FPZ12_019565 [Amycolatopsis acidicola]|uniref:Uncharacterized protein n=1 Tax=Amycolatopsis acidicola TaxID=2596893 RepID=A0A5N0V451_9PSEU|nr:hypothetical protein [Amycolatopsis acidicola]KAA9159824.1 hypothetical protein FPZ12_019565 [Amycolatopsis acidicola]